MRKYYRLQPSTESRDFVGILTAETRRDDDNGAPVSWETVWRCKHIHHVFEEALACAQKEFKKRVKP
jgi:hypothetical protein